MYLVAGVELDGGVFQAVAVSRRLTYPINDPLATLVCVQIINVIKEKSRKRE